MTKEIYSLVVNITKKQINVGFDIHNKRHLLTLTRNTSTYLSFYILQCFPLNPFLGFCILIII